MVQLARAAPESANRIAASWRDYVTGKNASDHLASADAVSSSGYRSRFERRCGLAMQADDESLTTL